MALSSLYLPIITSNHQKPAYLIVGAIDNGDLSGLKATNEVFLFISVIHTVCKIVFKPVFRNKLNAHLNF